MWTRDPSLLLHVLVGPCCLASLDCLVFMVWVIIIPRLYFSFMAFFFCFGNIFLLACFFVVSSPTCRVCKFFFWFLPFFLSYFAVKDFFFYVGLCLFLLPVKCQGCLLVV